ncbi:MAG TPA: Brp/Blh family beta-carotene 15,15'-dioxygenase [Cryomorphaceae bacterium]|nr:Brp/Blh family beta-carotene 15,15'-dioxygenase [Cryomorphaceae bacterium]
MNKITFVFISCFFILLALYSGVSEFNTTIQVVPAIAFIALLGIPHGAIDHILFLEKSSWSPVVFYIFYLGLIGLYVILWLMAPAASMALFLALSAYHFGQSQFADLKLSRKLKPILYFSWGSTVLSGLIYFNRAEIAEIARSNEEMANLSAVMDPNLYLVLLIASAVVVTGVLGFGLSQKILSVERAAIEVFVMGLIQFSFIAFPILTAFTLFFVVIHSLKVLSDEYDFMLNLRSRFSVGLFLKLLLPYTVLSLFGSALLLFIAYMGWLPISNLLLVFILISVLTLPHSIVMEGFYRKRSSS